MFTAKRIKGSDDWNIFKDGRWVGRVRASTAIQAIEIYKAKH